MKTYKAYIKERSEGCDYTIGCARTVLTIQAESIAEAKEKFSEQVRENYSHRERRLKSAELFEVGESISVDMDELYKRIDDAAYNEQQQEKEKAEREEYERLKAKFGG